RQGLRVRGPAHVDRRRYVDAVVLENLPSGSVVRREIERAVERPEVPRRGFHVAVEIRGQDRWIDSVVGLELAPADASTRRGEVELPVERDDRSERRAARGARVDVRHPDGGVGRGNHREQDEREETGEDSQAVACHRAPLPSYSATGGEKGHEARGGVG